MSFSIKLFFIFSLLISLESQANRFVKRYKLGSEYINFVKVDNLVISESCSDKNCLAYKTYIEKKDLPLQPEWLKGGKNPNSVRCSEIYQGIVLIAKDENSNEQSVCKFKDGSYLR